MLIQKNLYLGILDLQILLKANYKTRSAKTNNNSKTMMKDLMRKTIKIIQRVHQKRCSMTKLMKIQTCQANYQREANKKT